MSNNRDNSWTEYFKEDIEQMKDNLKFSGLREISTFSFPNNNSSFDEISNSDDMDEKLENHSGTFEESSETSQIFSNTKMDIDTELIEDKIYKSTKSKTNMNLQTIGGKSTDFHTESIDTKSKISSFINDISHIEKKDIDENNQHTQKKRNTFLIEKYDYNSLFAPTKDDCYSKIIINQTLTEIDANESHIEKTEKCEKKRHRTLSIKRRKDNADNIRKRIKAAFLKSIKNCLNEKLKAAGSKKFFTFLPQTFVSDISRKGNHIVLNLSLEQILSKNFCKGEKKGPNLNKYLHNLSVLEYLNGNKSICEKSGFEKFKKMEYSQIYDEYFHSREFQVEICKLKDNNESEKYIKQYISKASNFLSFFKKYNAY